MPLFSYAAIDRTGKEYAGERTAKDEQELADFLRSENLLLIKSQDALVENGEKSLFMRASEKFEALMGVSLFDKLIFCRNLSVMIHAGLPLTRALQSIGEETNSAPFKAIIARIEDDVTKGKSFADALSAAEDTFGGLFVSMVQAGEVSGKLDQVLSLLARQMKKDYELRSRVRGAMMYPAIILTVLVLIGVLMMMYVVPTLSQALKDLGAELPLSTQLIIFMSDMVVNYFVFVFLAVCAAALLFYKFIRSEKGKPLWDAFVIRVPLFGALIRKMNMARVTRILAYLLASGVPIVRSLEIVSQVVGNTHYRVSLEELSQSVVKGETMGKFFHVRSDLYDPLVAEMVSAGEETGKTAQMLLEVAVFFEQDVNETTKDLSTIIEPVLMVCIGIVVGFFALSVLQPIYGSLGNI